MPLPHFQGVRKGRAAPSQRRFLMCMVTRKQIVVVVALIAGIALAVPAAATGGQNSIAVSVAPINPDFLAYQKTSG